MSGTTEPTGKPSWARKEIGLLQIDTQKQALLQVLLQVELNLRPESGPQGLRAREELRNQLLFLEEARKALEPLPTRPKMPWSDLVVRVYQWATAERLNTRDGPV